MDALVNSAAGWEAEAAETEFRDVYYDDMAVGDRLTAGEYAVTREAMVAYARQWDPLPIHTDDGLAAASLYGGLVASGCMTIAIKQWLVHRNGLNRALIGSLGFENLKFAHAVRAGDRLSLVMECVHKRESKSRPEAGIVQYDVAVVNQDGTPVLTYRDILMVAKRPR